MKFVGLFNGEFKIIEDIEPEKLEGLKADFAWIDVDKIDSKTEMVLKRLYEVKSLSQFGFPTIIPHGAYDLVFMNYFENLTKKDLQIMMSDHFVITVHQGGDSVCDETMASLNEMLVSGNFTSEMILQGLIVTLLERHNRHLRAIQESLRNINLQMKKGLSDPTHLFQLNKDVRSMVRVFYATKSQLADIVLKAIDVKGVQSPEGMAFLYAKMSVLTTGADGLSEIIDDYINGLMPFMWKQMNRTKSISIGVAIFSLGLASAALFTYFFPDGLFGIDTLYLVTGIIVIITLLAVVELQKKPRFTLS